MEGALQATEFSILPQRQEFADDHPATVSAPTLVEALLQLPLAYAAVRDLVQRNRALESDLTVARHKVQRLQRLRRFVSPAVANLVLGTDGALPRCERRDVTVVFIDLRGFTAFTYAAAPEDVSALLDDFHALAGHAAHQHRGVIERFTGDGLMVFFNAPAALPESTRLAVQMALTLRDEFPAFAARWRGRGHDLDMGIGIARGFATVGVIGFEGRYDYGIIGTVTNLAARLCGVADGCRILASRAVVGALDKGADAELVGDLVLKGFPTPVATYRVDGLRVTEPVETSARRRAR